MRLKVIPLFANEDQAAGYGDIYNTREDCLKEHPTDTVLEGFGVLDEDTGFLTDDSDDIYWTEEEALGYLKQRIPRKVRLEISFTEVIPRTAEVEVELTPEDIEDLELGYGFSDRRWVKLVQDAAGEPEMLHDEVDYIEVLDPEVEEKEV